MASVMVNKQQIVAIDARGQVTLDSLVLSDIKLSQRLTEAAAGLNNFELHVHADEAVPYGRVAQIMAIAQRAGVSKLSFMTVARQ